MKLTPEQYKDMCDQLRRCMGIRLANKLIQATQDAFGTVDNVIRYYPHGLVVFANDERWIHNLNEMYGRFYRVDINANGEVKRNTVK